jgi:regulator of sigma E protease
MNILPIPALDGGHVVILCIEMILGRPLSDKIIERIQTVGMFILIALTIFVFGNDILQLFIK